jgi:chaperonin GroES
MSDPKKVNLIPLGKRVLVAPMDEDEEKTEGGLIIPDTAKEEKTSQGKVVKLGTTRKEFKFLVEVGDKVFFKKYSPDEVEIDGEKYLLIEEEDILAIVK